MKNSIQTTDTFIEHMLPHKMNMNLNLMLQELFGNSPTGKVTDVKVDTQTTDCEKVILLQKIQERQQKELYFRMLSEDNRKQAAPNFKAQLVELEHHFHQMFPGLFQGIHTMPENEKKRLRQPTIKVDADVFRKQFTVNEFHKIVKKDPKDQDPDKPKRAFDSYGTPNWTLPWKPTRAGIFNKSANDGSSNQNVDEKASSEGGVGEDDQTRNQMQTQ